jgi:cell division protein ZapA (FtsZ GTPase activity inhibitor)
MDTLIPINIVIGDRSYRVKVAPEDEEVVRKTLKMINDKILEFKTDFAGKDMQDYISMVVLWYATQRQTAQDMSGSLSLDDSLNKLEALLDKASNAN